MSNVRNFHQSLKEAIVHKTRCSEAWLIEPRIIFVKCKTRAEIELKDAKEDMRLINELTTGIDHFVTIIDTANIKSISKEARDWYSQSQNDNPRNASVALIVNSFYTRVIANFFLGFKNSRTEIKIFDKIDEGIEWSYERLED